MIVRPVAAVLEREVLKLFRQRGRLLAAMVRPLLWLLVIGAGFAAIQERQGAADYQSFLVPGVLGMTLLFGAMLAALSTVYDKESGVLRMLVIAPIRHFWIVLAKALGATLAATLQALMLLALLALLGYVSREVSIPLLAVGIVSTAFACASLGMLIAASARGIENFATLMNFVIFPVFFLSGSLYPVQQLPAPLQMVASLNPYTYGVDLLKHARVAGPAVAFSPDFSVGVDLAVLIAFSAAALAVASLRFSRDAAHEPLVRGLARSRAE
ncbi:MAG TPA: ABC transporter permease [Steroidobacteraceae bacterium]|nr:ABC transporter permease [Steroidobacteraceae bacterium]